MEQFGVVASLQRDLAGGILPEKLFAVESWNVVDELYEEEPAEDVFADTSSDNEQDNDTDTVSGNEVSDNDVADNDGAGNSISDSDKVYAYNQLPIDFTKLSSLSDTKELQKLTEYIQSLEPTAQNEYTGMFEGYNLIYLTAEGFSPYAVDEQLTPTLYKLVNSGFVAKDYYVPLWQTSTSDGEYVNLTGLIPDQQFSMKRSAANEQPFSLASYF